MKESKNKKKNRPYHQRDYLIDVEGVQVQLGDGFDKESLIEILLAMAKFKKNDKRNSSNA